MAIHFDIVVVGGGHAGCEAASAAARLGKRVAMVTLRLDHIGRLSCNPAVGGLGKGHLVREIDALGGCIARVADATTIQFRRLNTRKGLAVRASRAQVDIDLYPKHMRCHLDRIETLTLIEDEVIALHVGDAGVRGVRLGRGEDLWCGAVVLTTGTFLGGVMHQGLSRSEGGRVGDEAAHQLSSDLASLGLRLFRLKTGTTPRLDAGTIHWDQLQVQEDVIPQARMSFARPGPRLPQVDCYMAYTNDATHAVIRSGFDRSPMFRGDIVGSGPRYCPSVEDKVARYPDRERHLVFLEPEGLSSKRVYPNGLSTSLPRDVQDAMVRTIGGLQDAVILQYGYAVEYDVADPRDLGHDLQHVKVPGLFLAGQVNGTSGYEEAAAQGLVAGISAALGEPFRVGRDEGYVGVLVDDLVSRGVGGEPYRMFTSRAEHRLLLREDNADRRLMPRGRELGLVDDDTWQLFCDRRDQVERANAALHGLSMVPSRQDLDRLAEANLAPIKKPTTAMELLRRPDVDYPILRGLLPTLPGLDEDCAEQVEVDAKYAGYVARAQRRVEAARKMEAVGIPEGLDWTAVPSLSNEVRERLARARPDTLGAAQRVPGVTPAAVNIIAAWLARTRGTRGAAARS